MVGRNQTVAGHDVKIINGSSSRNGRSLGTSASGDGIDCLAGGDGVVIDGTRFEGNLGNGIVIKTMGKFNPEFGHVRDYLVTNVIARSNVGASIAIECVYDSTSSRRPRLDNWKQDTRPRAKDIGTSNCRLEYNATFDLFLNGLKIRATNCLLRANGHEGIRVDENARDITVSDVTITACSTYNPGSKPAVTIESGAAKVRLQRLGMDGLAPQENHRNGIEVFGSAKGVVIEYCTNQNATTDRYDRPVVSFQTSGARPAPRLCR